jgi:malonate transporter
MSTSIVGSALLPIMLVIALAFLSRRVGLVTDSHVAGVERITYVVFFPTLLFSSVSRARFEDPSVWTLCAILVGLQLVISIASWVLFTRSHLDGPSATSAFQGAIRFNSYVVFALLFAVFGQSAIETATVPLALIIITVNLFCVAILARYGELPEGAKAPPVWRSIATNPLIIACALGLAINPLRIDWPGPVDTVFDWFGTAAIALGLFAVGAGLRPISGKGSGFAILASNAISLVVSPALFVVVALAVNLPAELAAIGLICTVAPTATSSYILARQLGGNGPLMAQIVTVGTVMSALTVTGWFLLWPQLF